MAATRTVSDPTSVRHDHSDRPVRQAADDHDTPHDAIHLGPEEKQGVPAPKTRFSMTSKLMQEQKHNKARANPPGGFDATPLPQAPQGYTVKFTIHRASNLPPGDLSTQSSDPFLEATLATSLPKRHKEDPELVHRTRTIRRSLEPVWEEDWIVANIPASGFALKCRLYDEDWPDHNDRLGNVTILVSRLDERWTGFTDKEFEVRKRVGSKRAYMLKAATAAFHKDGSMTPKLFISAVLVGKSDPPHGQMYTVGPTTYFRHFSPMIGRLAGVQVNDEVDGLVAESGPAGQKTNNQTKSYDFQAVEMQLQGPVPPKLYHRYVEFRPLIGLMFSRKGIRGRLMHKALRHQHKRIYNFDSSTEWGSFKACSEEASLLFLKMAHFDQGGRIFTYVLTLDGLLRFTETGKEFGIDLLSKHTMHSDVATYIACSGEFFIRRLQEATASENSEPAQPMHPSEAIPGGPPGAPPPMKPEYYQLVIDNDSGTYRPDKSVLPQLGEFLRRNFPGLGIVTLASDDDEDQRLKEVQRQVKKKEGANIHMVRNRSPSSSSLSSDDVSDLDELASGGGNYKSKREKMWDMLEQDGSLKGKVKQELWGGGGSKEGGASGTQSHVAVR